MRFSYDFLLKMLENDDPTNLQTKFGVHITSNIFQITKFENHGITILDLPTLKTYPTPGGGVTFEFFSLK